MFPRKIRMFSQIGAAGVLLCAATIACLAAQPASPLQFSIDGQLVGAPATAGSAWIVSGKHVFTGLPMTGDGWTDIDGMINASGQYSDARIVYVSSTGNDSTGKTYGKTSVELGGRPSNPAQAVQAFATLSAAYSQLRSGYPDVMFLRRGDRWTSSLSISKAGRSKSERMIVAAYGDPSVDRPIVNEISSGSDSAKFLLLSSMDCGLTSPGDHAYRGENVLVEDYRWKGDGTNLFNITPMMLQGRASGIRRSTFQQVAIYAGWGSTVDSSASFLEENTWYGVPISTSGGFVHNAYLNYQLRNLNAYKNQSIKAPGAGLRMRGGGLIEQNLVATDYNSDAFDVGNGMAGVESNETVYLRNNVVMHGSGGVHLHNITGGTLSGNIFTAPKGGATVFLLQTYAGFDTGGFSISDNIIHNWQGSIIGVTGTGGSAPSRPLMVNNNTFMRTSGAIVSVLTNVTYSDNRYYSGGSTGAWFSGALSYTSMIPSTGTALASADADYPDANRDMSTYMRSEGVNPSDSVQAITWYGEGVPGNAALRGAVNNRRGAWDPRFAGTAVINYIRTGFGRPALQ